MNQKDQNHFDMHVQVQRCLDGNPEKWNFIPALTRYKNMLDENIQLIREKDEKATGVTKGITVSKSELRQSLAMKMAIVAGAMYAYASEHNDSELLQDVDISYHELAKLPEQEFINKTATILDLGEDRLEELADQAITAGQLTDLSTSLDDFREMKGLPRTKQLSIRAAKDEVSALVDQTNDMLREQMDKSMLRFRTIDEAFYESYQNARTIVDR